MTREEQCVDRIIETMGYCPRMIDPMTKLALTVIVANGWNNVNDMANTFVILMMQIIEQSVSGDRVVNLDELAASVEIFNEEQQGRIDDAAAERQMRLESIRQRLAV